MKTAKHLFTSIVAIVFLFSGSVLFAQELEVSPTQMSFETKQEVLERISINMLTLQSLIC